MFFEDDLIMLDVALQKFYKLEKADRDYQKYGSVELVQDGFAVIWGCGDAVSGELIGFPNNLTGLVINIFPKQITVMILGDSRNVVPGMTVYRTKSLMNIPVGPKLLGRVINPVGQPIDGLGEIKSDFVSKIEVRAPGIVQRVWIAEPIQTGLKAVDSMVPIGRGQRELIIGDRQTGKTTVGLDTIINQVKINKDLDEKDQLKCVYVAVGLKRSSVAFTVRLFKEYGCLPYTSIVAATASEPAAFQFLAPYSGTSVAEWFRDNQRHSLVIYDDLTKHAIAYRQLSLLLRRPPAREAFPGDVFYLHSRLLERSAKLHRRYGWGSLTSLPIIETQENDVSSYIPTNVISITDGQIFLDVELFYKGCRPAVEAGTSVSRVGSAAQTAAMRTVSGTLKLDLAQYREVEAFAKLGSDLDPITLKVLNKGTRILQLLKQDRYSPLPLEHQIIILYAGLKGFIDGVKPENMGHFENFILSKAEGQDFIVHLKKNFKLTQKVDRALNRFYKKVILKEYVEPKK